MQGLYPKNMTKYNPWLDSSICPLQVNETEGKELVLLDSVCLTLLISFVDKVDRHLILLTVEQVHFL
ncbi:hypothetical protein DSUL_40123 [Desulfovibrionales bacterium]